MLNGYKSYINAKFNKYYKKHFIIPFYLLAHFLYLTQPLNINIFSPFKKIYNVKISVFTRANIIYIIKNDFFPVFRAAFDIAFIKRNIKSGF